jgi:hypothetical protein
MTTEEREEQRENELSAMRAGGESLFWMLDPESGGDAPSQGNELALLKNSGSPKHTRNQAMISCQQPGDGMEEFSQIKWLR